MTTVASKLPNLVKTPIKQLRDVVKAIPYYGTGRYCPICGKSSRRFRPYGRPAREDAQCPRCGSLERHRLLWLYLTKKTDFFDGKPKKMLHVAPELIFESKFKRRLGDRYLTADLYNPRAMVKMDITNIDCPDQSFDVIYCSHVLEHVQDDRKAMSEFYRVLKNTGWAILLVPITVEKTLEDPSIVDPEERLKVFGQEDHVRKYGLDYVDRLREAGFHVELNKANDLVQNNQAVEMGITHASGEIYYCTKQSLGG
ncbi:MAG: methyltransferase domain-containing protein [Pseudomonadota bacterium]